MAILQRYTFECMHFVIRNIIHFINGILSILVIATYLFIIDWRIGLFIFFMAPFFVLTNTRLGRKNRDYGDRQREYYGGYVSWLFEIISALRDIRMLGAQKKVAIEFEVKHKKMFAVNIKSGVLSITADNIITLVSLCIQLAIFALAGYLALSGNITIGLVTIIVAFFVVLTSRIKQISETYLDAQNRISSIQKIYDFLHTPTENIWPGK